MTLKWLMIDVYQGPSPQRRRPGRKSVHCPHKRGLNSKLHLAVDSHGMPVRLAVTEGTVADCSQALPLIEGITNEIIATVRELGMDPVIPPKSTGMRHSWNSFIATEPRAMNLLC